MFQKAEMIMVQGVRGRDWKGVGQHLFWGGGEVSLEWGRAVVQEGGKVRVETVIPAISWTATTGLFSPDST